VLKILSSVACALIVSAVVPALACVRVAPTSAGAAQNANAQNANAAAQDAGQPTRRVEGRTLVSDSLPKVRIEFGKEFKYVGGHVFILYEVARAEQHFFVDADKDGRVRRFYWVQFEGYLPTNSHAYNYKALKSVNIGGLDFVADAYARNIKLNPGRADSDGARAREFLAAKGYRLASDEVVMQRLVHLVGEPKRDELMIIYLEDLGAKELTAADFAAGGRAAARWDEFTHSLLERAIGGMKISR
jgi:hypothetical protein